ncbi:MAG TPA: flagellar FliJ family protein [Sphingomonadales bacterium]
MKAIQGMIRLHRWQADEKRRELAELEAMRDDLLARRAALEEEIRSEQSQAQEAVVQFAYASYIRSALARRETLGHSIAEVERNLEIKREELAEAVRDLKKFETAAARRAERMREEAGRREQSALDEMSLNIHRRRG